MATSDLTPHAPPDQLETELVEAKRRSVEANATFSRLRQQWTKSLAAGAVVKTSLGKAEIIERLPSDPSTLPSFKVRNGDGVFVQEAILLDPWTAEDEAAEKHAAHRRSVCEALARADETTLAAIEDLLGRTRIDKLPQ